MFLGLFQPRVFASSLLDKSKLCYGALGLATAPMVAGAIYSEIQHPTLTLQIQNLFTGWTYNSSSGGGSKVVRLIKKLSMHLKPSLLEVSQLLQRQLELFSESLLKALFQLGSEFVIPKTSKEFYP